MKTYIGTKIVKAEPMSQEMFQRDIKKAVEWDEFEDLPGYHVVYSNPLGEYHSWSPVDVFDEAYREISDGEALFVKGTM